ncbi:nuclear valosin-containing protein-like isoform X2 [Oncorhynchus nerka]|uniref:nuclear valosin-containing protein-like isoform X2 n=1 Tax=Oncorhynchus nerka TaxID=8023 RepID=UPI0031B83572
MDIHKDYYSVFWDIIDPAVLRPGRLDKTLYVSLPPPSDRHAILLIITRVTWNAMDGSSRCHSYSNGPVADIRVSKQNFEDAFKKVRPSVSKKRHTPKHDPTETKPKITLSILTLEGHCLCTDRLTSICMSS